MLKRIIPFLIFDLIVAAVGGAPILFAKSQTLIFEINKSKVLFSQEDELRLMVSKNCYDPKRQKQCMALDAIKKVSYEKVKSRLQGGKNPGIVMCEELLKGEIVFGTEPNGNQNAFCAFSDGTYVDTGTLIYYGIRKDHENQPKAHNQPGLDHQAE